MGVQLPASDPTREEHEALVAAVRRLAAALMWGRGTAFEPVMTAQDEFGERIPKRIVKQTFDIAALAGEQAIPQERLRARTVEQRVGIPMPPIVASPLVLASDEPAENPEELRLQGRGLRELLDAGDDATSVLPRNTRVPSAPGDEQWSTLKPTPAGLRERPDAGDDETSVLPRARQQPAKNPRSSPRLPVDQPGDQACRDSADAVHRQGCRCAYCDAATGPSDSEEIVEAVRVVPQERISEKTLFPIPTLLTLAALPPISSAPHFPRLLSPTSVCFHRIANALPILSSLLHSGPTAWHPFLLSPGSVTPSLHAVRFVILCRRPAPPSALLII